ncbi:hypothetical protein DFQ27_008541 [Actinomortierella ambigua]|uniref:RRM domain-containing protein n=1 Tax=Actinomortierella ambigua TaxID=1343610 RepID=A0A9P6QI33_9FUNG|nr:hypothetical protein DFQ27_008541 [Actinomortierella ambigua]
MSSLLSFSKLALSASFRMAPSSSMTMAARGYATKKLFIGNISFQSTEAETHEHLQQYGTITDLYFPKDEQGRPRGFGFVEMDEVDCEKVIEEANGRPFMGRELRIQYAERKEDRPPRRAGGGMRSDGSGFYQPRGDRQFRPRGGDGEQRQFRPRRDGGERQFRPRGGDGEERQFRPRRQQNDDESQ